MMKADRPVVYVLRAPYYKPDDGYINGVRRTSTWQLASKNLLPVGYTVWDNDGIRLLIGYLIPLEDDDG
jgi:hypothetical protein